jgi:hypothetical protein
MKIIVIGVAAAMGLLGGAVSIIGNEKAQENIHIEYIDVEGVNTPAQYINFEPMEITGYIKK